MTESFLSLTVGLCLPNHLGGLLAFGMPSGWEWIVLLVIGLLIFGRRLPEVGRSLGRGIVEFKKGIKGIEEEIEDASDDRAGNGGDERRSRLSDQSKERPFMPDDMKATSGRSASQPGDSAP